MSDSAYPDALPAQYRLHWYVLERVLGQGGFGITYLARDTNLDHAVAIKEYLPVDVATRRADATVRPRSEDQSERYRWGLDRFIREARTLARFDHPNIVRVHSVFEHNGTAYMVMRFEEGENFAALLERRRSLGEDELMRVLLPILDGLVLVHDAGFIHRDIKPDNIHIRADGSPVLLDFGSARHSLGHARTVTILVAPGYAPFEQYYSSGEDQGPWTDIYSLGATCYRAISGSAPMDAIARSKGILGSTKELLVPAAAVGAGRYSAPFLKAVDHALAFAEKDRPATIALWRKELVDAGAAAAPTIRSKTETSVREPPSPPVSPVPAKAPVAQTAALVATVALIAAIGGGIGAYMTMKGAKPPPEPTPTAAPEPPKFDLKQIALPQTEQEQQAKKRAEDEEIARQQDELARKRAAQKFEQERLVRQKAEEEKKKKAEAERSKEKVAVSPSPPPPPPAPAAPAVPPKGDAAAFTYYRDLAGRGNAEAALRLGEMYEAGQGALPNNNTAYLWYLVAEQRGATGAKSKKDAVATKLQPLEIQQMIKQARGMARPGN